jgi:hypothetical protein
MRFGASSTSSGRHDGSSLTAAHDGGMGMAWGVEALPGFAVGVPHSLPSRHGSRHRQQRGERSRRSRRGGEDGSSGQDTGGQEGSSRRHHRHHSRHHRSGRRCVRDIQQTGDCVLALSNVGLLSGWGGPACEQHTQRNKRLCVVTEGQAGVPQVQGHWWRGCSLGFTACAQAYTLQHGII